MDFEDSFIDEEEVKKNVINKLLAKAKYRKDGKMHAISKRRIELVEALSNEEINFVCSPETYDV